MGNIRHNYQLIARHLQQARDQQADIAVFPELCLTGYPPEDLLLKPAFIKENQSFLEKLADFTQDIIAVTGFAYQDQGLYNAAAVICNKKISCIYKKQLLPNYSVFDEERYFQKGSQNVVFMAGPVPVGINICEDIYYSLGPASVQAMLGDAPLIINISASPYYTGKIQEREKLLFARAVENRANILYVNLVGGQDELVFDGSSMVIGPEGQILARAKPFCQDTIILDLDTTGVEFSRLGDKKFKDQRQTLSKRAGCLKVVETGYKINNKSSRPEPAKDFYHQEISNTEEEILKALVLGTRDYVVKNGFSKVVLGLSGGIDSAFTAVVAWLALGYPNVNAVLMPSIFSSEGSIEDSVALSKNLDINYMTIPISKIYDSYIKELDSCLKTSQINITKENLQARIRGNLLMAMSNEYGWLVLATGNKSEVSVGYSTLYGDMVGGFSPIKDVYKTTVYSICNFINQKYGNIIPRNIIDKPPSAELKPEQKDQDSLPEYKLLDSVLKAYIEEEKDHQAIIDMGFDPQLVKKVINMVDFSEYKRRQGAPGIKITPRAFGKDRRYPITNGFRLS